MSRSYVDILVVTDARLVGGGNKSLAEEIMAHSAAGYTTGLISLSSPAKGGPRPFDGSLYKLITDGLLRIFRPDDPIEAKLVIARGPSIFSTKHPIAPKVRAEHWLLIANAYNTDPAVSAMTYDPLRVADNAAELFGHQWTWVPLSPVVRRNMLADHPKLDLSPSTWTNIIDLEKWHVARPNYLQKPIRVGRHSRDAPGKWPIDSETIFDAYPDDPKFKIHVMGGASVPKKVIGKIPDNWKILKFGAVSPLEFLKNIDFYPYYHHPSLHEAFGRALLEAMAAGVITILPHYFESIFAGAALYRHSFEVKETILAISEDSEKLQETRTATRQILEERFSYGSHVERLRDLIGPPRPLQLPSTSPLSGMKLDRPDKPVILFFTDNGHGLGHVTRLMGYAKRLSANVQPYFLTMSEAYHLVRQQGFPVEYFPSAKKLKFNADQKPAWEQILQQRLRSMLDRLHPAVVVVDHVNPPEIMREIRHDYPNTTFIWSRRGLWRQQRRPAGLRMSDAFDIVLEPIDLASAVDMGFTPQLNTNTVYIPPTTLVQREELLPRDEARQELGIPRSDISILLNLSADTPDALINLILHVERVIKSKVAKKAEFSIFAPKHALHSSELRDLDHIIMKPVYPIAEYAAAFDGAISTAGYNSYHELVHLGVPTIFVARETNTLDDQNRRAAYAELGGFGLSAQDVYGLDFEHAVEDLLTPQTRERIRTAAYEVFPDNGAPYAARYIESTLLGENDRKIGAQINHLDRPKLAEHTHDNSLLEFTQTAKVKRPKNQSLDSALAQMPSGNYLPLNATAGSERVLVDAMEFGLEDLRDIVDEFAILQVAHPYFKPLFLVSANARDIFSASGFVYETGLARSEWNALRWTGRYSAYCEQRFIEMISVYRPQKMVRLRPGEGIPRWLYVK